MQVSVYKNRIRTALIAGGVLLQVGNIQAQFGFDYLKAADDYFKKGDYSSASAYYEKYLTGSGKTKTGTDPYAIIPARQSVTAVSSKEQAVYHLAESYRLLTNYTKAEPLYRKITDANPAAFPLAYYDYAVVLRAEGKYGEAERAFNAFLGSYKKEDTYTQAAHHELNNLHFIHAQLQRKDVAQYSIRKLAEGKEGASYAPVWLGDTLLFTATWPDAATGKDSHTNHVYQAVYKNGALAAAARTALPESRLQEGAATVSEDGNTLYLTRWTVTNGKKAAAIYISKRGTGKPWSAPVLLDTLVNAAGFNAQQPFLLPGGRQLLYTSDRPGGFGGYDLWYATLDNSGKPVATTNLGNTVNTAWNEQAAYYHQPSATLVFASDGRTGMGGYDLFYSKGSIGTWSTPENFGYPVNSTKDDMYFISRSKGRNILDEVVLSSDRTAVCCLELMALHKEKLPTQVVGKIVSCDNQAPLTGVAVNVIDTVTQAVVFSGVTDADGTYAFALAKEQPLSAVTALKGYVTASFPFQKKNMTEEDTLVYQPVCLVKEAPPLPAGSVFVLQVYYELNKAAVTPQSYPELDKVVAMLNANPDRKVEIGGHTDDRGSAALNQKLSEERAANVVAYLVSKGIDQDRLAARGYGASQPIAPNKNEDGSDNPDGREKNRRTEMKILLNTR